MFACVNELFAVLNVVFDLAALENTVSKVDDLVYLHNTGSHVLNNICIEKSENYSKPE